MSYIIICWSHLVTTPHDLQVEYPFDCPSLSPYVHVLPSVEPHDLHASLYSCPAAGGSPNVGIIQNAYRHQSFHHTNIKCIVPMIRLLTLLLSNTSSCLFYPFILTLITPIYLFNKFTFNLNYKIRFALWTYHLQASLVINQSSQRASAFSP